MTNQHYINYHDAVLYNADLDILRSKTAWLNDSCIHYQMMRYQFELHKVEGDSVLFMDPSVVSYLMHQCSSLEELMEFSNGQRLYGFRTFQVDKIPASENSICVRQIIFLPINDTNAVANMSRFTSAVGNHWSLLVVIILVVKLQKNHPGYIFQPLHLHFDSMKNSTNCAPAVAVARKMNLVLFLDALSINDSSSRKQPMQERDSAISTDEILYRNCKTPQQINSCDCGIHMLCATNILATELKNFVTGRGADSSEFEQLLLFESSKSEDRLKFLIADRFASKMEEILQCSVLETQQKSFASALRNEILHSTTFLLREKIILKYFKTEGP
jgi:hypothetical protein